MKIITIIVFYILCTAASAAGDEIGDALPDSATDQLKEMTRGVIKAGMPREDAITMVSMMIEKGFRPDNAVKALNIAINAFENEIPVKPITNKAFEGMAKKVPDDFVVQAMETVLVRHAFAKDLAMSIADNKEQVRGIASVIADNLSAGMRAQEIDRIMGEIHRRSKTMASSEVEGLALETFHVTKTMARKGVSSKDSADVVCQAHQQDFNAKDFGAIRDTFSNRAARGNSGEIANQFERAIGRGERAESLGRSKSNGFGVEGEEGRGSDSEGPGSSSGSDAGGSGAGGSSSGSESGGSESGSSSSGSAAGSSGAGGSSSGSGTGSSGAGGSSSGSDAGCSVAGGSSAGSAAGCPEGGVSGSGSAADSPESGGSSSGSDAGSSEAGGSSSGSGAGGSGGGRK